MDATINSIGRKKLDENTKVQVPSSKSHTIRALLIASFADGESSLTNPLDSADARSCIEACRAFGALIDTEGTAADGTAVWKVTGNRGRFPDRMPAIDVGNSGTTLYLAAGMAALAKTAVQFTGDEQIQRRSADNLLKSLEDLGTDVKREGTGGCAPFTITGPLTGGTTSIECPTSQYLSALLLATPLATAATGAESIINVPLLMEQPYVEMTLRWLDEQGISYKNNDFKSFEISGGQSYKAFSRPIPGDFSSATFFFCAAAITGSKLIFTGLDINDSQGDKAVLGYLEQMGCKIVHDGTEITVIGPGHSDNPEKTLRAAELDINATPDALPAMAVTACFAEGETKLVNVAQARIKETDRIAVMAAELSKLGAEISELDDGLIIKGGSTLKGCKVEGHGDHRIVMSLAIAGLKAEGTTTITDKEAVAITYPGFFDQLNQLIKN